MSSNKDGTEGCALSKITAFRCFQIHHAMDEPSLLTEAMDEPSLLTGVYQFSAVVG
jgi:hypothetical protein